MFGAIRLKPLEGSSYGPVVYSATQLAARKETIIELETKVQRLPREYQEEFRRLEIFTLLRGLSPKDLVSKETQFFLNRNAEERLDDLWSLFSDCWHPGSQNVFNFTPIIYAWMVRQVLVWGSNPYSKNDIDEVFLKTLLPPGSIMSVNQILDCLPNAAGIEASCHGPLGGATMLEIREVLKDHLLFKHDIVHYAEKFMIFLQEIPQLPQLLRWDWDKSIPATFIYDIPLPSLEKISRYFLRFQEVLPSVASRKKFLAVVLILSFLFAKVETRTVRSLWGTAPEGSKWYNDMKYRGKIKLEALECILLDAALSSVEVWPVEVPAVELRDSENGEMEYMTRILNTVLRERSGCPNVISLDWLTSGVEEEEK